MSTLPTQARPNATNISSRFLASHAPVRYGVAAIIVATVVYSSLGFVPMLRRDLYLLHNVDAVSVKGMRLEADLLYEVHGSRGKFLRALLAMGNTKSGAEASNAGVAKEIRSMLAYDAAVARTETQLAQLSPGEADRQRQFHESWHGYLALRDQLLAKARSDGQAQVLKVDPRVGEAAFAPLEESVHRAAQGFEDAAGIQLAEASRALEGALKEILILVVIKVIALALILLIDWKRNRAEKRLQQATRDLQASEDRFRKAYETATVGMGMFTLDGTVLSVNSMGAEILGYRVDELIGTKVKNIMAPEEREDHLRRIAPAPGEIPHSYQVERRVIRKDGSSAWVRNSVTFMEPEGQEPHFFSITQEITLEKQARERLEFLANFDPVTNLPNRHFFEQQVATELRSISGRSECAGLLYLEIDSFDFVKGTFGSDVADEVLSELGAALGEFRREGEWIARLDDHVFGMLVKAAPYDEATLTRASELRDIFHRASEIGKHRIPLSASIGIAYSEDRTSSSADSGPAGADTKVDTLIQYARAAMLEARSRGGDSIYLADPALQERAVQRHRIESALLRGLRQDEFRVVFQPQFEVASGKLVRFEALCRWNSSELGPIPPDRFIPIAEQTGLIMEIGRRIMHEALCQAKTWTASGRRIGVAVNISPMQFMRPDFTQTVMEVLAQTQFPAALLELEITEGIFIRDLNLAVARIRELQRLGLSVALDDFGTGYSSLSYLQRMPIDAVKLDRSFVSDLTTDAATVSMVRSVLAMANALHLRVVTEGVETEQQLQVLRELGCDEAQGYLLGRPESSEMALRRVLESPLQPVGTLA